MALDAAPEQKQLAEDITAVLGRVPNFVRTVAHSPAVARWLVPFVATLHREGTGSVLDARTKNLVILRTSMINGCEYCVGHNRAMAKALGVSDERVDALESDEWHTSTLFDDRDRAVIAWAEEVTRNTARYNKACFETLAGHFNDAEIVELTLVSGMFNMVNRFNDSLHVDLEDHEQQRRIGTTAHMPEARIMEYVRRRVDAYDAGESA